MSPPSLPPPLTRWYIDTRPLDTSPASSRSTSPSTPLPLIHTLQPTDQDSIRRYHFLPDRLMSLGSALLKTLYVHRTLRIPWSEITISRTPAPHKRPCYLPPEDPNGPSVEFNVSHQAGLVALVGCPKFVGTSVASDAAVKDGQPRLGVDITCANESTRKQNAITTTSELIAWIDIFAEVFSDAEIAAMKAPLEHRDSATVTTTAEEEEIRLKLRRFYSYWALKEAYIKMVGEGLIAPWLKELEFRGVSAPEPGRLEGEWGPEEVFEGTWLGKRRVEDVQMRLMGFEDGFIVATAARGVEIEEWPRFERLDIERDIGPCATGECGCIG